MPIPPFDEGGEGKGAGEGKKRALSFSSFSEKEGKEEREERERVRRKGKRRGGLEGRPSSHIFLGKRKEEKKEGKKG